MRRRRQAMDLAHDIERVCSMEVLRSTNLCRGKLFLIVRREVPRAIKLASRSAESAGPRTYVAVSQKSLRLDIRLDDSSEGAQRRFAWRCSTPSLTCIKCTYYTYRASLPRRAVAATRQRRTLSLVPVRLAQLAVLDQSMVSFVLESPIGQSSKILADRASCALSPALYGSLPIGGS